jgi:hypothetical protein
MGIARAQPILQADQRFVGAAPSSNFAPDMLDRFFQYQKASRARTRLAGQWKNANMPAGPIREFSIEREQGR